MDPPIPLELWSAYIIPKSDNLCETKGSGINMNIVSIVLTQD